MSRSHPVDHVITHPCQSKDNTSHHDMDFDLSGGDLFNVPITYGMDKHEATMGYVHEDTFPMETSREHAWDMGFEAGVTSTVTTWKKCTRTHNADKNNSCYLQEPLIPLSRLGSKPPNRDLRKNEIEANMESSKRHGELADKTKPISPTTAAAS